MELIARIGRCMRYRLLIKPFKTLIAPLIRLIRYFILLNDKFERAIIVKINGGLGAQMSQYIFGRLASKMSGLRVLYDLSWFEKYGKDLNGLHNRSYELDSIFPGLVANKAGPVLLKIYSACFDLYPGVRWYYEEELLSSTYPRYLSGDYGHEKYTELLFLQIEELKEHFKFNVSLSQENKRVFAKIEAETCPVAIHIRRGDYVGSRHDVVTPHYFKEAVKTISERIGSQERAAFFVFSNGMEWSRDVLSGIDENFIFVENNDNDSGAIDMYLMSKCRHLIISNSTFSWWAALLSDRSPDKIVILPNKWLSFDKKWDIPQVMKENGWVQLPVE
jgi:hypothetical protein